MSDETTGARGWAYSLNGEDAWTLCDSREDALEEGVETAVADGADSPVTLYLGRTGEAVRWSSALPRDFGDMLAEWLMDEWGDGPVGLTHPPREAQTDLHARLVEAVDEWEDEHDLEQGRPSRMPHQGRAVAGRRGSVERTR